MSNIVDTPRQSGTQEKKNGEDLLTLKKINDRFKAAIKDIYDLFYDVYKILPQDSPQAGNILRSQVFFLDSALDSYVHDIVKYCFKQYTKNYESKNNVVSTFSVKFETLKKCMGAQDAGEIHQLLLNDFDYWIGTCMKYDAILKYLNMVGINLPSNYTDMNEQDYNKMKQDIDKLSNRRNKIGHNSDLDEKKEKNEITNGKVNYWIKKVENLQKLIQNAAESAFPNKQ